MKNNQIKTVMKGALILSVASLIAKILSAFYRIPLENLVGNTGFYVYQQIYPIYGIAMTFSLSGFPVYISKVIAQQEDLVQKQLVAKRMFKILVAFSLGSFLVLNLGAGQLALWMGDQHLASLINSVSFSFLLIPFLAVARGYYQGTFEMLPTAISQVSEQLVRVFVIILVAYLAVKQDWSYYQMGTWAMFGSTLGGLVACVSLRKFYRNILPLKKAIPCQLSYWDLAKNLFSEGLIICLFASMMVLLQLVDSFTIKNGLQANGVAASVAKELKGTYDRAQPLVQLGLVVAASFSATLLPALTKAIQNKNALEFKRTATLIVKLSLTLAFSACAGLIVLMPQVNTLLFGDASLNLTISVYVLSILIVGLISTYTSILQSVGQFKSTLLGLIVAILIKAGLNTWLIEIFGILGASLATVLGLVVALIIVLCSLPEGLRNLVSLVFIRKIISCTALMVLGVAILMQGCQHFWRLTRVSALLECSLGIVTGCIIFLLTVVLFKVFTLKEWVAIPGAKKILRFCNKTR